MFIEVNVMGKFKRKFKKEINKNTEDFDSWFEKNQDRLSGFTVESEATYHKGGNVLVKNCRVWIPILALLCCIAICVAVLLPILLNKGNNDFDLRFGEESVYPSMISDAELQSIIEEYPFISKMHITSQGELKLCDDDSLVFTIIDGEIDTGDNYYLYSFHTILCRKSPKTANSSPQFPPIYIFGIKNKSNLVNYSHFFGACDRT